MTAQPVLKTSNFVEKMASIYLETRPAVGHGIVALNLRVIHRKVGMSSCAQFNARALQANRLLVGLALWTLIVHGLELRASPLADPCLSISTSLYPRQTIPVTSAISTAPPSGLSSIPAPSPSSVSVSEPNPTQSFPPSANSSLPSLDGFIEQSTPNSNNVTITLQNNGLQDLLVYTPFSFLSPGLESQTLHLYAANGTQVGSPPPANIDFGVPTDPSNFTTIAVGRSLEANLDLTEIFNISRSGNYTVSDSRSIVQQPIQLTVISHKSARGATCVHWRGQVERGQRQRLVRLGSFDLGGQHFHPSSSLVPGRILTSTL